MLISRYQRDRLNSPFAAIRVSKESQLFTQNQQDDLIKPLVSVPRKY